MENAIIEALYPISFRQKDAMALGQHLKNRNSVVLIGIKRVGISNFLRFFLNHQEIAKTYIADGNSHLFIPVDLNDLVEREVFPFWILTLKRIIDSVENSGLKDVTKKHVERLFLDSMQSKDTFLTIENIKKSLTKITQEGFLPTVFFIRFDRLKEIITSELFGNLQGLKDAANQKVSYVFTSFRGLTDLEPKVFTKSSISLFAQDMYVKPAENKDTRIIFDTYKSKYKLSLSDDLKSSLLEIVDGYVQYLQLALISLQESSVKLTKKAELFDFLSKDERIILQSEELWESLNSLEQGTILKIENKQKINPEEKKSAAYLWGGGFVVSSPVGEVVFSPLFSHYLKQRRVARENASSVDFSKKENLLFTYLKSKVNVICEREEIIQAVWSEVEEIGVSDWAIDRLVARLRVKLKSQKAKFEIQTVKTRGYKMIES
ncbi:MAG: helix-turn-helix domain-containing protein [Candidatus Levybacteria bacterium]|nr:helix-turn-helix domain-containing protein [Candidatus Levybacteria bacterium]MDZ4227735.1 helix-turn-helix domain-containing protein [Candidatus Levybacteria bacterium]